MTRSILLATNPQTGYTHWCPTPTGEEHPRYFVVKKTLRRMQKRAPKEYAEYTGFIEEHGIKGAAWYVWEIEGVENIEWIFEANLKSANELWNLCNAKAGASGASVIIDLNTVYDLGFDENKVRQDVQVYKETVQSLIAELNKEAGGNALTTTISDYSKPVGG